ncbi:DUF2510 domain-containing protein [Microbacterium sp. LRZ72]|uniref:DUF2510 domain-containing protein n=1 Tax=Microbacterium sp. LRZ72 TaxID=2942481 RepID=UPI0029B345D2|nr:DUF2510 domain-containing protein [Microbacterium sp. LRZ72]MDX2375220.1 DUF2510 domain-containing protein [Microbacterium sp. LRZ72]
MSDESRSIPPAGWYPDPTTSGVQRWWDGARWTEHTHGARPAAAADGTPPQAGTPTNTVWIWLVVLLPLLSLATLGLTDWRAYLDETMMRALEDPTGAATMQPMLMPAGTWALVGIGYLVAGATVLFAWLDWRTLARRGIHRPFHWGWAALALVVTNGVYVIGRGVVLRRRTGKGLAPVWAWIAVNVVSLMVGLAFAWWLLSYVFELMMVVTPSMAA